MTYDFKTQLKQEQTNRKPLNILYEKIGNGWIPEIRLEKQKAGIDGYSVINNKMLSIEEKIHCVDINFNDELFLELEHNHFNKNTPGWSVKPIEANLFVEYCAITRQFFIYKTKSLFEQVMEYHTNNTWPKGHYYPAPVYNEGMRTTNIKVPRHYFKQQLLMHGTIALSHVKEININETK